ISVEGVWHLKGNHNGPPENERLWAAVRCQLKAGSSSKVPADGGEEAVRCQLGGRWWHRCHQGGEVMVVGYQPIQPGGERWAVQRDQTTIGIVFVSVLGGLLHPSHCWCLTASLL